ncbi:MAG: diguanylate cyclase [Alteromonas sp.]|jgi:diguanylate cyclase (GGDEF)-like protein|uniref:diguanylate cyclase n=1 Tax=Alteromonas sp. TaxID=232 RepID=UPI0032D97CD7
MLYRFIIALLLILPIKYGVANEERIARVEQQLSEFDEKSVATLPLLIELASTYLYKDPALAERYALQALPISVESKDDISRAEVSRLLGMATMYQGKNEEAFTYLTRAITAARNTNNPHLLSVCNRSLGVFYELTVDYDNAMKFYIDALKFAKLSEDTADLAMVYGNLGNVLNSQGDYDEAADYFKKARDIHKQTNNTEMVMNMTVGLGMSYLKSRQLDKAQNIFENVLASDDVIVDFTYSEASVSLAHVYQQRGLNKKAIDMYKYVIENARAGSYPQALASAYLGLGDLYQSLTRYDDALRLYRQGIVTVKNKTSVESEIALYESLAMLELKLGNYEEAAKVQAEYIDRRNAIQPVTQSGIIKKLEAQIKNEQELIKLQERLLQREREARNSSFYLFSAVVISLICALLFLTLLLRRQKLLRLEHANEVLIDASETDYLTGIGNRRYLDRKFRSQRGINIDMAFLLLDIDYFKAINDTHGHDAGDKVLVTLAHTLKGLCQSDDIFARIGGEEFVIMTFNKSEVDTMAFAERLRGHVEAMIPPSECPQDISVTVSIGVAIGSMKVAQYDVLYKQADIALFQAKTRGRNQVKQYSAP